MANDKLPLKHCMFENEECHKECEFFQKVSFLRIPVKSILFIYYYLFNPLMDRCIENAR